MSYEAGGHSQLGTVILWMFFSQEKLICQSPPVHECKPVKKHIRDSSGNPPCRIRKLCLRKKILRTRRRRLQRDKTGCWSEATKEEPVQRLDEFEDAYPDRPKGKE